MPVVSTSRCFYYPSIPIATNISIQVYHVEGKGDDDQKKTLSHKLVLRFPARFRDTAWEEFREIPIDNHCRTNICGIYSQLVADTSTDASEISNLKAERLEQSFYITSSGEKGLWLLKSCVVGTQPLYSLRMEASGFELSDLPMTVAEWNHLHNVLKPAIDGKPTDGYRFAN